jgi:hypothetical protein
LRSNTVGLGRAFSFGLWSHDPPIRINTDGRPGNSAGVISRGTARDVRERKRESVQEDDSMKTRTLEVMEAVR